VVLYEDPLSPWCLVAERRIVAALEQVGPPFARLRREPFPLRVEPVAMSRAERRAFAATARRAAKEPEARGTTPELWLSPDPPLSSMPILAALFAARLQGPAREAALHDAIRDAALVRGVNPARADVLFELAERAGLDLSRFASALAAPGTERRVREGFEEALADGIGGAPALVIGDEWLVAGARSAREYRSILSRYVSERLGVAPLRTLH
jgi:predicted DsbA family dithiol-disulfide isomerase